MQLSVLLLLQIAHFLHNDEAFKKLSPDQANLTDLLLPPSNTAASVREVENLRVRIPDCDALQ